VGPVGPDDTEKSIFLSLQGSEPRPIGRLPVTLPRLLVFLEELLNYVESHLKNSTNTEASFCSETLVTIKRVHGSEARRL
jgi:hypothetical protein